MPFFVVFFFVKKSDSKTIKLCEKKVLAENWKTSFFVFHSTPGALNLAFFTLLRNDGEKKSKCLVIETFLRKKLKNLKKFVTLWNFTEQYGLGILICTHVKQILSYLFKKNKLILTLKPFKYMPTSSKKTNKYSFKKLVRMGRWKISKLRKVNQIQIIYPLLSTVNFFSQISSS
jgi:hypothetical protein